MRRLLTAFLITLALTGCAGYERHDGEPPMAFTTDGCSGGVWIALAGEPGPWQHCCVAHDVAYWRGGHAQARESADAKLLQCVAGDGYPWVAMTMFLTVRVTGHPTFPTSWRWGYGWPYQASGE